MSTIQESAEFIVKSILPEAAQVQVNTRDDNGILVIEVSALPEYVGQLIGKDGKIIKSLRTLLNLSFPDVHYLLEIKE